MGNCCAVEGAIDHWIYVKTGDRKGAGTDANINLILHDDKGNKSDRISLTCAFSNDFERGKTDVFQAPPLGSDFGNVILVELWRDAAGPSPDWYCEVVVVNDTRKERDEEKCFYFPVQRWVASDFHYMIRAYDTSLPQDDPYPDQRQRELTNKRKTYEYDQKAPDLPLQIKKLPEDEQFSDEYKWDLNMNKAELLAKSQVSRILAKPWTSIKAIQDFYRDNNIAFPEPAGVRRATNDACFGAQRLIGCNPTMIKLATALPENMGVTAEMLRPFLEGWTLKQIIDAKRLFLVDLNILENLPTKDDKPICAPLALFFVTGDKSLVPIAIQLHQDIAPDNPVFLPNDPPFTWMLAKMWFNLADSSVHQSLSHLGYTHIVMEGICIATHRTLSPTHPIFKLLAPHFLFLLAINWRGLSYLISPGGWVDKTMQIGREGLLELIRRGMEDWRIDVHGNLPKELESRGVLDPKTLPNYAYRDDGIMIHKAIETYVMRIVKLYYTNPTKIQNDAELQMWAREMATPIESGGLGIQGVPNNGRFRHTDEIALVCTSIIFTCSVQHAATNFPQYEEYGFPLNYPALLQGFPPTDKVPRLEEEVCKALPDEDVTLDTMVVTRLLSARGTNSLGEWEFQYQYDPPALKIEKEFREGLARISKTIRERNAHRDPIFKYPYLDPDIVPNSISI